MEEEKLDAQMDFVDFVERHEQEIELLKEKLRIREEERERQKKEWDMKQQEAEEETIRELRDLNILVPGKEENNLLEKKMQLETKLKLFVPQMENYLFRHFTVRAVDLREYDD